MTTALGRKPSLLILASGFRFVCEEEPYFLELVRYLHLNPLRAHLVGTIDSYRWSGHRVLIGRTAHSWQDCDYVLSWFGNTRKVARTAYLRSELASHLAKELGISYAEIARHLGVSPSAITRMVARRGRKSP